LQHVSEEVACLASMPSQKPDGIRAGQLLSYFSSVRSNVPGFYRTAVQFLVNSMGLGALVIQVEDYRVRYSLGPSLGYQVCHREGGIRFHDLSFKQELFPDPGDSVSQQSDGFRAASIRSNL
jgi:hypothetical protein